MRLSVSGTTTVIEKVKETLGLETLTDIGDTSAENNSRCWSSALGRHESG